MTVYKAFDKIETWYYTKFYQIERGIYKMEQEKFIYTYKDLQSLTGKTLITIQNFIKENSDFVKSHSMKFGKNGRFIKFDEEVKTKAIERFGVFSDIAEQVKTNTDNKEQIERIKELEARIEALEKENKGLKEELEKANSERQEAIENTHMALLALQQEKQEKQLLLMPPKKSLGDRIKNNAGNKM